jgi:hypothetical protein
MKDRQLTFSSIYFALSIFFMYVFYIRFWKWRYCIEQAKSSCITPDGDNVTSGGMLWAGFAVLFLVAGIRRLVKYARR